MIVLAGSFLVLVQKAVLVSMPVLDHGSACQSIIKVHEAQPAGVLMYNNSAATNELATLAMMSTSVRFSLTASAFCILPAKFLSVPKKLR